LERAAHEIDGARGQGGQYEDGHEPGVDVLQEGELEDVKTDISAEKGILDAERSGIQIPEKDFPLSGPAQSGKESEDHRSQKE